MDISLLEETIMLYTETKELQKYRASKRLWQGIPSIEVTKRGRIFLTFYSGGVKEEIGNYVIVIKSDDGGNHFSEPIVIVKEDNGRCFDPCLWIDPLGELWLTWAKCPDDGLYASVCRDPDAEELVWGEEFLVGHNVMMNKPIVVKSGEWLFPIAVWNDGIRVLSEEYDTKITEKGSFVYATNDCGKTFQKLGFADVVEVAIGADLCSIEEAKDFMREVPEHQPFMATSCCPAWSVMAKKLFPTLAPYISMALTPMVLTARMLKKDDPDACIAFIGPCAAKKLEASRRTIRSDVDFVLTFEELMGMFNAKGVTFEDITDEEKVDLCEGTGDGRGFAVSGGVAKAVADVIHKLDPEREVKVVSAQGLKDCRKLLTLAKAGKYDGYLLEGMACPGGCVAGAGTLQAVEKSTALVNKYVKDAPLQNSLDSKYEINLDLITESHDDK